MRTERKRARRVVLLVGIILLLFTLPLLSQTLLAIPGFNQAYRDQTGYWGTCRMGTGGCPDRIETAGCLITSLAAVLNYYGITLKVPSSTSCTGKAREGMDPGILNDWLKTHGGYGHCAEDNAGNCCLEWTAVPPTVALSEHENRSSSGLDGTSRALIDQALARGYPVIAGVHWGAHCHGTTKKSENCHWIVITGKSGLTYTITDPYNRDRSDPHGLQTTLSHGVFGPYTIDRFVVVEGPVPPITLTETSISLSFFPASPTFHPGETQTRVLMLTGNGGDYLVFARVIDPQGNVKYAYYPQGSKSRLSFSPERRSLYPTPIELSPGKNELNKSTITTSTPGTYTWEVWLEDPHHPGIPVALDIGSYTLTKSAPSSSLGASIGIAIGMAILLTLITSLIVLAAKG